ncbi:MAG TPA: NAD(+)/NADH kinase [Ignavibacteria bacterium]|nr:NAD(+)/NADH kinase [Ignavibacteria bacterium]
MIYGITGNAAKEGIKSVLADLTAVFKKAGIRYYISEKIKDVLPAGTAVHKLSSFVDKIDIIISVGGDGTFLETVKALRNHPVPILGVNVGTLGFMSEVVPAEIKEFITDIEHNKFKIVDLCVVSCYSSKGKILSGINEIVIDKSNSTRLIEIEIYYNSEFVLRFLADGVIISTPTGSTGYSMSAGGPIVSPNGKVFIITPISPHTLNFRPLIVPDDGKIRVIARSSDKIRVTADGHSSKFFDTPAELIVTRSSHKVKTIKSIDRTYFQTLNTKLFWGADIRNSRRKNFDK